MLTINTQPAHTSGSRLSESTPSVLIIGRSEKVLKESVDLVRKNGRAAGATNDFDNVLTQFDIASLDVVVVGSMVPPETRESLRTSLVAANPTIAFVQGLAGIPGLIAAQVEAALAPSHRDPESITYDGDSRRVSVSLDSPERVRVIAFWGTAFVPPDPESTSEVLFDATIAEGTHIVPLPTHIPVAASFVAVYVGRDVHPFAVGPMPGGSAPA